jgi:Predicted solute binding protein
LDAEIAKIDRRLRVSEQATVNALAASINAALDNLVLKKADYTKVDKAIEEVNKLNKDQYNDFTKVEAAVSAVKRDLDISKQAQVDAMADAINEAINNLVLKKADYTEVDKAIEEVKKLNKNDYNDFTKVEAAVSAVKRDLDISKQAQVDAMAQAIRSAVANLEKKPTTPVTPTPVTPTPTPKPGSSSTSSTTSTSTPTSTTPTTEPTTTPTTTPTTPTTTPSSTTPSTSTPQVAQEEASSIPWLWIILGALVVGCLTFFLVYIFRRDKR